MEDELTSKESSHAGSLSGYTVEARHTGHLPVEICGQVFDARWRVVSFERTSRGVPAHPTYKFALGALNLLDYAAAQAMRWWLHAEAEAHSFSALCLESRLVEHHVTFSVKAEPRRSTMRIGGDDRSNRIPDWGGAKQEQ